ncbi:MAG TPA: DUF2939 domain-containing protein [Pyrinomonadaceae bacterium]|nr:DUF2939 domain-containing protein [Pyrinomonadaceae bacterium]
MSTMRGKKSKETKRSRFVVNVDELQRAEEEKREAQRNRGVRRIMRRPKVSPQGRRRLGVVAGALALVALGLAVIFYSWYSGYRSSPVYSLALLADAAGRDDRQTIDALLDTDGVTRSLVPQVKAKVAERAAQTEGGPPPIPAQVRRYVEQNAAVLVPGARDAVRDAVVASVRRGAAGKVDSYPFFAAAVAARLGVDDVREEGDVATVTFTENNRPVELMMQRSGSLGHWRIVSLRSDELAERIADNLSRGLPALGR